MSKYRVFISYSHGDLELVEKIVSAINKAGLLPMWDKDFLFGRGFQEMIKDYISYSHIFLPVITKASCERGWVHQEIGYAIALNVPVLPVTYGTLPGEMIRGLHAVQIPEDLQKIEQSLNKNIFDSLIESHNDTSHALYQSAELTEDRTIMMAKYANDVLKLETVLGSEAYGLVRQKGGLSSLHIPDNVLTHSVWKERYGKLRTSQYHCRLQRNERLALEKHVSKSGCRLIINPCLTFDQYGTSARIVRLKNILDFLENKKNYDIQVAFNHKLLDESLTIVGDWFAAISVSAKLGQGYQQTVFTRHAPSMKSRIDLFDQEFDELLKEAKWTRESSREDAIEAIKEIIATLQQKEIEKAKRKASTRKRNTSKLGSTK
jgi:hypothetical protein